MIKRIFFKIAILFVFLLLFITPIIMIKILSDKETEKYIQDNIFEFREKSYGLPDSVRREDVEQYFSFSGSITSNKCEFIELGTIEGTQLKTVVSVGDEVMIGDTVAYCGEQEIKSEYNGIVEEIVYTGGYIKLHSLESLKLTCMTDMNTIEKIKKSKDLKLENGKKVEISSISNNAVNNMVKIDLIIEDSEFIHGQEIDKLKIYTGIIYRDVMVIDKKCVYQKMINGPHYIRIVDELGFFIEEKQVEIGFETNEVVTIANIPEGTYCDSGYKAIINANGE